MLKKVSFAVLLACFQVAIAYGATMASDNTAIYKKNGAPQVIFGITVTAQTSAEITAQKGIDIIIPDELYSTWSKDITSVTISGPLVGTGKLAPTAQVTYPGTKLKIAHIALGADLMASDYLKIDGLKMRFYDRVNGMRYLGVDTSGDGLVEANDINGIRIDDSTFTDNTTPYQATELNAVQNTDGSVLVTWVNPPDIDLKTIKLTKTTEKNGLTSTYSTTFSADLSTVGQKQEYKDVAVSEGEKITYALESIDSRNNSEQVAITLTVLAPGTVTQPSSTQQTTIPTQQTTTPLAGEAIQGIILTTRVDKTLAWGTWLRLWYVDTVTKNIAPYGKYQIEYMLKGDGHKGQILQQYGPTGRSNARATFKCDPEGIYAINIVDLTTNKLVWAGDKSCIK